MIIFFIFLGELKAQLEIVKSNQELVLERLADQNKVVRAVGKALIACAVVGGVCGFVLMTKAALHSGSILLKFTLLYPSDQVREEHLVREINKYFRGGINVNEGDFEALVDLVQDSIKGDL